MKTTTKHWAWRDALLWLAIVLILLIGSGLGYAPFAKIAPLVIGLITAFGIFYFSLGYQRLGPHQRQLTKYLADTVFIGLLLVSARDYSQFFFILFFLPIASAAIVLNGFSAIVITIVAVFYLIIGHFLNLEYSTGFTAYSLINYFEIFALLILAVVTRLLAIRIKNEESTRHFMEEKIRQADEKMIDVQALEEEFVSVTAHQLNTPLSIIKGYSSMLIDGDVGPLNPEQAVYVSKIKDGAIRLAKLVNDLLDIHHVHRGYTVEKSECFNLDQLVKQVINQLQEKMRQRGLKLAYRVNSQQSIDVCGNSLQLAQAIGNILDNAIKYSHAHGELRVQINLNQAEGQQLETQIVVEDDGVGIPEEEQGRIFQRFYRADNSVAVDPDGTGLGLYITKRIIEAHGGAISFSSKLGQGTRFQVTLPAHLASPYPKQAN